MLFENLHTKLHPKEEHITEVRRVLVDGNYYSPSQLVKQTGLSLTAVRCVLEYLHVKGKIQIVRQQTSPKLQVKMK